MINRLSPEMLSRARSAYFIGIGGAGMSAIAKLLHERGIRVFGSDLKESRTTQQLQAAGIPVFIGQKESKISPDSDLIVYSSAIAKDHLEMKMANQMNKTVFHRAEVLSAIVNDAATSIAVAGTHGKTTTASMIAFVLHDLGKRPTCLIGGEVIDFGTNALIGSNQLCVSEVDESDQTHELFYPNYSVITNLEEEHVDHYKAENELNDSFRRFLAHMHHPGLCVYFEDDVRLRGLVLESSVPKLSFGFSASANVSARNVQLSTQGVAFDVFEYGLYATRVNMGLLGLHNVLNALACFGLLSQLGIEPEQIADSLSRFHGAKRRLEIKFRNDSLVVVNDYAHNPTKVKASVQALKVYRKPLTVIFQPHRYTRTQRFYKDFAQALRDADQVIVTDIYSASEINTTGIHSNAIVEELRVLDHPKVLFMPKHQILAHLEEEKSEGVIAFLGAGDIGEIANEFSDRFKDVASVKR